MLKSTKIILKLGNAFFLNIYKTPFRFIGKILIRIANTFLLVPSNCKPLNFLTHTQTLEHTHTYRSQALRQRLTPTQTHTNINTHSHPLTHTPTQSQTHTLSYIHTHTLTHTHNTHPNPYTHAQTHKHTHSNTQTRVQHKWPPWDKIIMSQRQVDLMRSLILYHSNCLRLR